MSYFILSLCLLLSLSANAVSDYQSPPAHLSRLIDAPRFPSQRVSPSKQYLLLKTIRSNPSIKELANEEVRLAGLRINPSNFSQSRIRGAYEEISIVSPKDGKLISKVSFDKGFIAYPKWSPSKDHIALTHIESNKASLYVLTAPSFKLKKLKTKTLNAVIGSGFYEWGPAGENLYYLARGNSKKQSKELNFSPIVQESGRKKTSVRTYQDLIQSPSDEDYFSYLFSSQLRRISLKDKDQKITGLDLVFSFAISPSGDKVLVNRLRKPFSYLVPYYRFPRTIEILDLKGKSLKVLAKLEASDGIPQGFSATYLGPRSVQWVPKSKDWLVWVEAQDGGDPKKKVDTRDRLFVLKSLGDKKQSVLDMKYRFSSTVFFTDNSVLVKDRWWSTRQESLYHVNLKTKTSNKIYRRSYEDLYTSPGSPLQQSIGNDRSLGVLKGSDILFSGLGYSPKGNIPYLSNLNLKSGEFTKLWTSPMKTYSRVLAPLDINKRSFLARQEESERFPNYYSLGLEKNSWRALTKYKHPYPEFKGVEKQELRYKRDDGVQLSAKLYLPANYKKGQKLPVLLWAYPREYKSKKAAGQIRSSKYQFNRISYWGPLPFLAEGFAVLDRVAMPIIGEEDNEPNDSFIKQLEANAKAALNAAEASQAIDVDKAFIGGHSYGAFMTANLLAHTDLFVGGIARSGAYNRTFTPFGFQSEERTYWQAPQVYNTMSPFQNAHKINEPILLIHGEKDNNSGTFPMQSKRLYHAISGLGGKARLVILPNESHGYRAKESLKHLLWEQLRWLKTNLN